MFKKKDYGEFEHKNDNFLEACGIPPSKDKGLIECCENMGKALTDETLDRSSMKIEVIEKAIEGKDTRIIAAAISQVFLRLFQTKFMAETLTAGLTSLMDKDHKSDLIIGDFTKKFSEILSKKDKPPTIN